MKTKTKKCKHEWVLIDKWIDSTNTIYYEFHCIHCLQIEVVVSKGLRGKKE